MNNKLNRIPPATVYAAKIRHSSLTVTHLVNHFSRSCAHITDCFSTDGAAHAGSYDSASYAAYASSADAYSYTE